MGVSFRTPPRGAGYSLYTRFCPRCGPPVFNDDAVPAPAGRRDSDSRRPHPAKTGTRRQPRQPFRQMIPKLTPPPELSISRFAPVALRRQVKIATRGIRENAPAVLSSEKLARAPRSAHPEPNYRGPECAMRYLHNLVVPSTILTHYFGGEIRIDGGMNGLHGWCANSAAVARDGQG